MLAIIGPTASGKSGIAVEIAKKINGVIINGDPFQAFRDIPIGTGQPSIDEQHRMPHIGYGELPLEHLLNPCGFGELVRKWLDTAQKNNRTPILVTGSGLYLKGIWNQLDNLPHVPEKIVEKARSLCNRLGSPALHRYLSSVDPIRASQIHPNDASRIQRAIALHIATGARPSGFLSGQKRIIPQNWQVLLVLPQREILRDRIAKRVKNMICAGWQNEIRQIIQAGLVQHIHRLHPLGYEIWLEDSNPETAERKIVQITQAYAKRQMTWFRNQLPEDILKLDPDDENCPQVIDFVSHQNCST